MTLTPSTLVLASTAVVALLATACADDPGPVPDPVTTTTPTSPAATTSSSASTPEPDPMTEDLAARCGDGADTVPTRPSVVETASGESLYAVTAGSGPRTVVLVHGSGSRGVCVWTSEVAWLVDAGLRVVAFDAACVGNSSCDAGGGDDVADLADVVEQSPCGPDCGVVVVAASAGGPLAVDVAAVRSPRLRGAVALSPAGLDADLAAHVAAAREARVPVLVATARDDSSVGLPGVREVAAAGAGNGVRLDVLGPGSGHAQELLYATSGEGASRFRSTMLAFVDEAIG